MRQRYKGLFHFSKKDSLVSISIMLAACAVCAPLRLISHSDFHVPLIFVLAVMVISRLTDGYFYGIIASVAALFCVNYAFTYPYFAFDFTLTGYPLTFISMLAVSLVTCTLTSRVKQQEKARIETEKEKMHANLLRAISHDLRTPLTSIIGATSAVIENANEMPREKQIEMLQDARKDAEWLLRVFENLLSITRIGNQEVKIKIEIEAVEEIFSDAVGKFRKQYPDIPITVSVPEELFLVPMDAILIEQVILNLLHNSAIHGKHTTEIRLSAVREQYYALFSIEDNGAGFSKEVISRLSKHNYRPTLTESYTDDQRNMGIGLSVCKAIIQAHKGSMTAETASRGGAVVRFILPLEEALKWEL